MPERTRPFMKLLIAEKGQEITIDTLQSLSPRLEMRRHMEGPAALPIELYRSSLPHVSRGKGPLTSVETTAQAI